MNLLKDTLREKLDRNLSDNRRPLPRVSLYRPLPPQLRRQCSRFEQRTASPLFGQHPVDRFLRLNGITPETARSLELGWTFRHYLTPDYGPLCPPHPTASLPTLVYRYRVEGRLVGLAYRSCRLEFVRDDEPLTYSSYSFSDDRHEVTATPVLPLPPYRIDSINPRWHPDRIPLLLVSNDELDVAAIAEMGYPHAIALTGRTYATLAAQLAPFRHWLDRVDCFVLCCEPSFANCELARILHHFFGPKVQHLELPDDCRNVIGIAQLHGTEYLERLIAQAAAEVESEEARNGFPGEEFAGEDFRGEEFRGEDFRGEDFRGEQFAEEDIPEDFWTHPLTVTSGTKCGAEDEAEAEAKKGQPDAGKADGNRPISFEAEADEFSGW